MFLRWKDDSFDGKLIDQTFHRPDISLTRHFIDQTFHRPINDGNNSSTHTKTIKLTDLLDLFSLIDASDK
jgi:hypothetical protein